MRVTEVDLSFFYKEESSWDWNLMKTEMMSSVPSVAHSPETFNSIRIFELFIPYRTLSAAEKFRSLSPEPDAQRLDRWDR